VLTREVWAWRWAHDNAIVWTTRMARTEEKCLAYVAEKHRRSGQLHPMGWR